MVAVLFVAVGSDSLLTTWAVVLTIPHWLGVATMMTCVWVLLRRGLSVQVTGFVLVHEPVVAEAETRVTPDGNKLFTFMPVAGAAPMLVTVKV